MSVSVTETIFLWTCTEKPWGFNAKNGTAGHDARTKGSEVDLTDDGLMT